MRVLARTFVTDSTVWGAVWCKAVVGDQRGYQGGGVSIYKLAALLQIKKGEGFGERFFGGWPKRGVLGGGGIWGGAAGGGGKSAHFCFELPRVYPTELQNGTDLSNY